MVGDVVAADRAVPYPAHIVDLVIGAGDRLRLDCRFAFEGLRLVGVAVIAEQGPVDAGGPSWSQRERPERAALAGTGGRCLHHELEQCRAHEVPIKKARTMPSRT